MTTALGMRLSGRLDVVVNNAGPVIYEELEEAARSWEVMRRVKYRRGPEAAVSTSVASPSPELIAARWDNIAG